MPTTVLEKPHQGYARGTALDYAQSAQLRYSNADDRQLPCATYQALSIESLTGIACKLGKNPEKPEKIRHGEVSHKLPRDIQQIALRKLFMLDKAQSLNDLRTPPANRLEALNNDRKGQHGIRINDQWRICFVWTKTGLDAVEIVDYY